MVSELWSARSAGRAPRLLCPILGAGSRGQNSSARPLSGITGIVQRRRWLRDRSRSRLESKECDMAAQLLLFANELRSRAKEILVRATTTDDRQTQATMR